VAEGSRDLDQLVCVAHPYNKDSGKKKRKKKDLKREKKKDKWREALVTVLREAPLGQSPNLRMCF
jgi:hypothetical protein